MFGSNKKKIMKLDNQQRKGLSLISKMKPKSVIAEQYRTIRTNIQFSMVDREVKSIVLTSFGPWEGKSTTSANLASVFSDQGKKVLLVDDITTTGATITSCAKALKESGCERIYCITVAKTP